MREVTEEEYKAAYRRFVDNNYEGQEDADICFQWTKQLKRKHNAELKRRRKY